MEKGLFLFLAVCLAVLLFGAVADAQSFVVYGQPFVVGSGGCYGSQPGYGAGCYGAQSYGCNGGMQAFGGYGYAPRYYAPTPVFYPPSSYGGGFGFQAGFGYGGPVLGGGYGYTPSFGGYGGGGCPGGNCPR